MPDPGPSSSHAYLEAARAVRDALQLRDSLAADIETAWTECAAKFPHLDDETLRRLRASFEAGYRQARNPGRLVIVPGTARPEEPSSETRPAAS